MLDVTGIFQSALYSNMNSRESVQMRMQAVNDEMNNLTFSSVSLNTITPNTLRYYSQKKKNEKYEALKQKIEMKKSTYTPPKEKKTTEKTQELSRQQAYALAQRQAKLYTNALAVYMNSNIDTSGGSESVSTEA